MHCLRLCLVCNPLSYCGIPQFDSVKQKVFISRKIYLFQKSGLPLQLRFSNQAMKNPKMMSSCFIFIYEQCLFTTTS